MSKDDMLEMAEKSLKGKDYETAIELASAGSEFFTNIDSLLIIANSYYYQEKHERSLSKIQQAFNLQPDKKQEIKLYINKASSLGRLGKHKEAEEIFLKLCSYESNNEASYAGFIGISSICYYQLLELKYADLDSFNKRTKMNEIQQKAITMLENAKAYAKTPKDKGSIHNNIGCILQMTSNDTEAILHFKIAVDLSEDMRKADALSNLALSMCRVGEEERSLEIIEEAKQMVLSMPDNSGLGRILKTNAIIQKEIGNEKEAYQQFKKALKIFTDKELHFQIAEVARYIYDMRTEYKEGLEKYLGEYYFHIEKGKEENFCVGLEKSLE